MPFAGDKSKWYSHQLEPIRFSVWSDAGSLGAAVRAASCQTESVPTDESGSDSDGAPSTSSSYSSLSDFVSEMQLSDLSPGELVVWGSSVTVVSATVVAYTSITRMEFMPNLYCAEILAGLIHRI